jgi:hypothetical protein
MPEILRWPFRVMLYGMMYIIWLMVTLSLFSAFPSMNYYQSVNILPVGWLAIGAVFILDFYYSQLRGRAGRASKQEPSL